MNVWDVQTHIDAGVPVVVSWARGAGSAVVLLVDIVDGCAVSKHKMRFPLYEITSITPYDVPDRRRP